MSVISIAKSDSIVMKEAGEGLKKGIMLPGAFPGIETWKCRMEAGAKVVPELYHDKIQIF